MTGRRPREAMDGADGQQLLIGRSGERSLLSDLLDDLRHGSSRVAVLVGEAGMGKSALTSWALSLAASSHISPLVGRGIPLTVGQPLQPVLAAMRALPGDSPTVGGTMLEATVADPVSLLLQRTMERLDAAADEGPVLVVLEDLHWADTATLTLVHHLATRADPRAVAVLGTCRPPAPGTALHHLVTGLPDATVHLRGLDPVDVAELVLTRFGLCAEPGLESQLAVARGNPLLVEATVESWLASRSATDPGPARHVAGPIRRQIDALAMEVLRLLQVAAVAGARLEVDLLSGLTGRPTTDVLDLIEVARVGGVLTDEGGQIEFRHELHRAAVLETLPASARAAIHLDVARELERIGAPLLDIVEHVANGARPGNVAAVETLTAAAEEIGGWDPSTALRISDLAIGLLNGPEVPERLHVVRIASLAACGQSAEAELLGRAVLRGRLVPTVESRVRRDLALAAFVDGRPQEAEVHMNRAVACAPTVALAARARTELAWTQFLSLRLDVAAAGAEMGMVDGDEYTQVAAHSLRCWLGLWTVDPAMASSAASGVATITVNERAHDWQVFQPLFAAGSVRLEQGDLDAARVAGEQGRRMALAAGTAWGAPAHDALLAVVAMRCGDLAVARERATAALDGTALVDGFGVEIWSRSILAELALRAGDVETARGHLDAARLAVADGRAQLGTNHLVLAEAELALVDGDRAGARAALEAGWEYLGAVGARYIRASVGAALVRLTDPGDDPDRMEAIVEALDADAAGGWLPLVSAEAARARAWIAATPAAVHAAVDAAAVSSSVLLELDMLRDAVTLAPTDPAAPRWAARAAALAAELGVGPAAGAGGRGPSPVRARFGPESLTAAERRVAELVAEGLTNAKIAARLVVSRRTVDSQVLSAYRKLGVSSRVALTRALLGDDRPTGS